MTGLGGNDRLIAGPGNDRLLAGAGDDVLLGNAGLSHTARSQEDAQRREASAEPGFARQS